jgi:ribosomal protein S18 acetylase RimI-like enzyme
MSALQLFHPASDDEARALLLNAQPPVDSPTQHRYRTALHLDDTLTSGRRRPDWVWSVRRADGPPLGVVAAVGTSYPEDRVHVLDFFSMPDDSEAAVALVAWATTEARCDEAGIFAPTGARIDDPSLATLVGPLRAARWRLLVERRHYEFEPSAGLGNDQPTGLHFERLTDPDDPRLAACHRGVMRDTLDAHDAALIRRLGFDEACRQSLAFLLEADPVECIHLATDGSGAVVGMVSGLTLSTGRAFVLFVGVPAQARGNGYGRQLLAWQTRRLLDDGATLLIADTDNENLPMARAFADVGWPQTETRIDLVLGE